MCMVGGPLATWFLRAALALPTCVSCPVLSLPEHCPCWPASSPHSCGLAGSLGFSDPAPIYLSQVALSQLGSLTSESCWLSLLRVPSFSLCDAPWQVKGNLVPCLVGNGGHVCPHLQLYSSSPSLPSPFPSWSLQHTVSFSVCSLT